MSVKVMGYVWDLDIPRDRKYLLLAYADHADHEGGNIFPSVDTMAKKTGYSSRSVQRITRGLILDSLLIVEGSSKHQTNKYSIPMGGGVILSPPDKIDIEGCHGDMGGVTPCQGGGDIAMSPEPSFNHQVQPSIVQPLKDSPITKMLLLWLELFPDKPQPRSTTKYVKEKVTARFKEEHFVANWEDAMRAASESKTLQSESWFSFKFFVANDENYQKCLDRWMAWKDDALRKNGTERIREASDYKDWGVCRHCSQEPCVCEVGFPEKEVEEDRKPYMCDECYCTPCICGKVEAVQGDEYYHEIVYNHMLAENQSYHFKIEAVAA